MHLWQLWDAIQQLHASIKQLDSCLQAVFHLQGEVWSWFRLLFPGSCWLH